MGDVKSIVSWRDNEGRSLRSNSEGVGKGETNSVTLLSNILLISKKSALSYLVSSDTHHHVLTKTKQIAPTPLLCV